MSKGMHWIIAIAALLLPCAAQAITLSVEERDDNAWSLQGDDLTKVNLADCEGGVEYVLIADLTGSITSGRMLYLKLGSTCNDTPESCTAIGDAQYPSDLNFTVTATDMFPAGCDAGASASLWVGLLENDNQTEDGGGYWSAALSITLDVAGPATVPAGLSARIGSGNVRISWAEIDVTDVTGFRLVYWSGGASDTDTDSDADAGADAGADVFDSTPVPYAADAGIGESEDCTVTGGPEGGTEYDQGLVTDWIDCEGGDATSATIDGLTNGVQYKFAVVSLDDAANPSVFSEAICATPEKTIDFGDLYGGAGGAGSGQYCFIATAAFGSYDHPTVRALRDFRDRFLTKVPGGRAAISAYYAAGPSLAAVVAGDEELRAAVADGLTVLSGAAIGLVAIGPTRFTFGLAACLALGLAIGFALPRRRRGE